jgi:apolipoprotein N-acyltransferase
MPMKIPSRNGIKTLIALGGGILMGLTPAPVEAWILAWIALIPLWLVVVQARQEKHPYRAAATYGVAWGAGYHGLALFWITGVHPLTWMGVPWLASIAIALFCWVFITFWGIIYTVLWCLGVTALTKTLNPPAWLRTLFAATLWCTLEMIWAWGNLYWTSLSYTQSPHNLVILHLGQISGALTITAIIVAVNGCIAEGLLSLLSPSPLLGEGLGVRANSQRLFLTALTLLITTHLIGWGLYSRPLATTAETAIKVGMIQGNIPNTIKLSYQGWRKALVGYKEGYETLAQQGVDVVLTPETALPFNWDQPITAYNDIQRDFYETILTYQVPVWLGGMGSKGTSFTNSLFSINGNGEIVGRYDKIKLVPLGEYIPFEQTLGRMVERLSPLDAHLAAGNPDQIFNTSFGRAIAGICYDSPFAEVFRSQAAKGGEFMISAANNAHYSAVMPRQHHAQDVLRAVETDRWAARATNTGYSAIVDPHGRTLWFSDLDEYQLHTHTIYRRTNQTLYVSWGNWLTPLLLIVTALSCVWVIATR